MVYINAGANSGLQPGDVFLVCRAGEPLVDPDTGSSGLGRNQSLVIFR